MLSSLVRSRIVRLVLLIVVISLTVLVIHHYAAKPNTAHKHVATTHQQAVESRTVFQHTAGLLTGCGVAKNPDGTYHFSQLHIARGQIVDENNCTVYLRGFNTFGTEFGDAMGGYIGSGGAGISAQRIAFVAQTFKMNLWRLHINITWWKQDAYVPHANMHYRVWIEQLVSWMRATGNYVELTRTNQYPDDLYPPCGGSIVYCSPQIVDPQGIVSQWANPHFLDESLAFWNSITPIYKDDPAILYDIFNEMPIVTDFALWKYLEDALILTVRNIAPTSIIIFGGPMYSNQINPLIQGAVPDFTEPNLMYDFHVYGGGNIGCTAAITYIWQGWPQTADEQVGFAQSHNHAAIFGEWAACQDYNPFNDNLINYEALHGIALAYYPVDNMLSHDGQGYHFNTTALLVQKGYASLP